MRQSLIVLVAVLTACASASPPPGGPEDKLPPKLVRVTPDTNAVNVKDKVVSFYFDETINDRGTGAQEVDSYFLVSPSDGAARVSWHRSRIDVSPRHDFRPNTAYTITMLPGLSDLHANAMKTGMRLVFSTGPTIPTLNIKGIAFDWVAERPVSAYLEAVTPDSVIYLSQADSAGKFVIGPLSAGTYLVRAYVDANNNRALDRNEPFDTLRVTVPGDSIELRTALRDTIAARMNAGGIVMADTVTLTVTFDRLLDPTQPFPVAAWRLVSSDSTVIPITRVLSPRELRLADSLSAKAASDSVRRADSLAGKPLAPIIAPAAPRVAGGKAPPPPPPKPSVPPPFSVVTLKLGTPVKRNTEYRLSEAGVRALSGRTEPSERRFSTPKPPPPKPAADSVPATPPAQRPPARPPAHR